MKKKAFTVLIISFFMMLLLTGCKKKETEEKKVEIETKSVDKTLKKVELEAIPETSSEKWQQMVAYNMETMETGDTQTKKGTVYVVSYHPQGQTRKVDEVDEINITFSEPVSPLQRIQKDAPSLIEIEPFVKGEGYWKSSNTYCYRMDEKLELSSRYIVQFKGYKSFTGKKAKEKKWSFYTPTIKIVRTKPYHGSKWQVLGQKVLVQFSQNVIPRKIKGYIVIYSDKGKHDFKVRYSNEEERKTIHYWWKKEDKVYPNYITITSNKDYPIATDIRVRFLAGLPPMKGNIGMLKEREIKFRTYEIFKIISVVREFQADRGIKIEFSNPVNINHFYSKVNFTPEVKLRKGQNWNSKRLWLKGKFKPGVTYTMTVPADTEDRFENKLNEDQKFDVKCLDYTPYFYSPNYSHFVFENYLDKKIPISVRNVFETDVRYKELNLENLRSIYKNNRISPYKMDLRSCSTYNWKIPVKKNRDYVLGFDLENINLTQPGFYYIRFNKAYRNSGQIFQLTDTAIVAKYSPTQIFLLPFNMKTGEPVPSLNFDIYDFKKPYKRGVWVDKIKGNKNGIAIYDASLNTLKNHNLLDCFSFSNQKKSFIWGRKRDMFDMWDYRYNLNLNVNNNPKYFYNYLFVFTDKHLYKGGQTVKFKGILRQIIFGGMKTPVVKNINIEVFDSRSKSIHKSNIDVKDFIQYGSFAGKFALPEDTPTGFGRIKFKLQLINSLVMKNLSFSVEEYKPAKFEVKVRFDQKELISSQKFSGIVNGRYLFGTPMIKAKGNCIWTISSTYFSPKGWDGYTFGTYESHYRKTIFKKDFKLNRDGNFEFDKRSLLVPGKNSGFLSVHGEVIDKDNNRISGTKSTVVHRGEYYIGVKTKSYFFKQNKPDKIFFVTVKPNGKHYTNTDLDVSIIREEWKSFQKKDASGALRWNWKKITEDILQEKFSLPEGKIKKEYTFKKSGYYKIIITGKDSLNNTITTSGHFYVTGSGYVSWGVSEGRTIDLVTDKKEYKPDENIELLIKSPFETSTALITIEREKVIWSKVIHMKGNADTVIIPVKRDFMPNVFVNVIILKERTGLKWDKKGNDIGKPEFYSGYKEILIDSIENKLNLEVRTNKKSYEPGDNVSIDINVTDNIGNPVESEVCISIVDKGVLNLVGYELPDPFDFFWKKRALDVKTISTLNDVLGRRKFKEKGEDPGGGGGVSSFGSVVVRKDFKESAFYSAFIYTDKDGKAQISFKLPDNLTTFKVMGVAGTKKTKFGRGNADILVKKNIVLKPALPNFARPGDQFSGGVTVTNNSDEKLKISVKVECKKIKRIEGDPDIKKITLKPGETKPVWFKFGISSIESPELTFKAFSNTYKDGLYQEIPIRIPRFLEAVANYGRVDKKPVREQLIVPDRTFRPLDRVEMTLASSAMVGVKRNFEVLQEFPYDCLEQRISKQYPILGAGDFLLTYGLLDMSKDEIRERIENLLKIMPKYQHRNGGFKYYPSCIFPSEYLTCYTVEFILDAKKKGYKFDWDMLKKAEQFLKKVAVKAVDSKYPYSKNIYLLIQSYAVYVLSKDNILMKDAINNLFEVRDRIPFSGLAYLVKALNIKSNLPVHMQPVLAKTMLNKMKDEPTMTHFENQRDNSWWCVHETNVKTTSIVLEALLTVYKRFPYAEKIARWLTTTTRQKRYMSTQEHIRLFMAFERYYRTFERETPDFVTEVLFNDELKIKKPFAGRELKADVSSIGLSEYSIGDRINISIKKEGTGMLYYLLRVKYYPIGEVESINRGFDVKKIYKKLDGKKIKNNHFKAGEKYIVEIVVKTKMERSFVILDDPVPAGLKVLNPRFNIHSKLDMEKSSRDSKWGGYWGNFYRSEYYFDRVEVFADYLRRGTHTWRYLVIATNEGTFTVPNTVVLEMYNPEVFGRNENRKVKVK